MDLELVKNCVNENIEHVLQDLDWREFENTIAEIFSINGFKIEQNFRFKTKKRYEIDVVAIRANMVFCVDCKQWRGGRYKKSGLKRAIIMQKERVEELEGFIIDDTDMKRNLGIDKQCIYPLIVTLFEENLIEFENCFIVPAWKLNSFLLDFEKLYKSAFRNE
jgi:Holliday junction resolvase-like predicted endonuclease